MNTKRKVISLTVVIACVVSVFLWRSKPVPTVLPHSEIAVLPAVQAPATPPLSPEENPIPPVEPVKKVIVQSTAKPQLPAPPPSQAQKPPKEPLRDPDARDALAMVGTNPDAERYWLGAIFDANLPDQEREDLMEDLNEVGFADPENPSAGDLPLIASRLQIIEEVLPEADDFMQAHLLEAYKDLGNMYGRVASQ